MSELTTTTPAAAVDEGARFRAFTALGLALVALMDGGVVANGLQWLLLDRSSASPGDPSYALALGGVPVVMSLVALWLASNTTSSTDSLARPLARSSQVLSALAILGAVVLTIAVLTQP
jgi:cytochrome bd-type quinol oxidase subunit 2